MNRSIGSWTEKTRRNKLLKTARKWLHKSWWGFIVAYPIVFFAIYLAIWQAAEPLGIPDSFNEMPRFTHTRAFIHLLITLIITPHLVIICIMGMRKAEKRELSEADKTLFSKFLEDFSPDGVSVRFLHEQDIGAPFESSQLDQIQKFLYYWHDAAHEFQNEDVESSRTKLYSTLKEFTNKLYINVSGTHRTGWLSMGLEDFETRQDVLKERADLNEMASIAYTQYQDFIRLCRNFN